jgi:hypothetical protein
MGNRARTRPLDDTGTSPCAAAALGAAVTSAPENAGGSVARRPTGPMTP